MGTAAEAGEMVVMLGGTCDGHRICATVGTASLPTVQQDADRRRVWVATYHADGTRDERGQRVFRLDPDVEPGVNHYGPCEVPCC